VESLSVRYPGNAVGVEGISLEVQSGEIVALIGPNGGGKTSTLRGIAGFLGREGVKTSSAKLSLDGVDLRAVSSRGRQAAGIAFVPERDKIFAELTVSEQLQLSAAGTGRNSQQQIKAALAKFPDLGPHMSRRGAVLSGGQRQMLAVAMALCSAPRLLVIDELSMGLAPILSSQIARILQDLARNGMAILIAEQSIAIAYEVASTVHLLSAGAVIARGTPAEMQAKEEVLREFLGA
jgi:branched-chain amino acid transport system ATP-binding protein